MELGAWPGWWMAGNTNMSSGDSVCRFRMDFMPSMVAF